MAASGVNVNPTVLLDGLRDESLRPPTCPKCGAVGDGIFHRTTDGLVCDACFDRDQFLELLRGDS